MRLKIDQEWLRRMAELEDGGCISVAGLLIRMREEPPSPPCVICALPPEDDGDGASLILAVLCGPGQTLAATLDNATALGVTP